MLGLGLLAVCGAALCPVRPGIVQGRSMAPSLSPGQCFLYRTGKFSASELRRGEVVLVRVNGRTWIKRVFAVGGQRYWKLVVGRRPEATALLAGDEPIYLFRRRFAALTFRPVRVPAGTVFVLGDSPTSSDSRSMGPIPEAQIVGRAFLPELDPAEVCGHVKSWSKLPPDQRKSRHARLALRTAP